MVRVFKNIIQDVDDYLVMNNSFHSKYLYYKSFYLTMRIYHLLLDHQTFQIDLRHFFVVYSLYHLIFQNCIKGHCDLFSFHSSDNHHTPQMRACYYEVIYVHFLNLIDFSDVYGFLEDLITIHHSIILLVIRFHVLYRFDNFSVVVEYHMYSKSEVIWTCH